MFAGSFVIIGLARTRAAIEWPPLADETPVVNANTNRLTSTDFGYDANGNIIEDIDEMSSLPREFMFNGDNIQVKGKANARPFPSVTGWAYIGLSNGTARTVELFRWNETNPSDLVKPMRPIN